MHSQVLNQLDKATSQPLREQLFAIQREGHLLEPAQSEVTLHNSLQD
jgi:hypothetical protein